MSWEETLRSGDFKGAGFEIEGHSLKGGKRGPNHEYPHRDLNYFQDMGLKTRQFSLDVFVIGDSYHEKRDALIAALESEGPGTLNHPYLGAFEVECQSWSLSESVRNRRLASFSLDFILAGARRTPSRRIDSSSRLSDAAVSLNAQSALSFLAGYAVTGQPSFVTDETAIQTARVVGIVQEASASHEVFSKAQEIALKASALSRNPRLLASGITDLLNSAAGQGDVFPALGSFAAPVDSLPQTTASRIQQVSNLQAFSAMVRRSSLSAEADLFARTAFRSLPEALSRAAALSGRIDHAIRAPSARGDTALYRSLSDLKASLQAHANRIYGGLPRVKAIRLNEATSSLVLAYELYEDATRHLEIMEWNGLTHPSFTPPNRTLEVLSQ